MSEHPDQPYGTNAALSPEAYEKQVQDELSKTFDYHAPTPEIAEIHEAWRAMLKSFAANMLGLPPTRERAVAMTRLEELGFWLHACIARNHGAFARKADEPKP